MERCLASLKKYDMEIVVVDTGSVDKTKQVIDEYADIGGYYPVSYTHLDVYKRQQ